MAVTVVVVLEVVEVDEREAHGLTRPAAAREVGVEGLVPGATVGEPGQHVGSRCVADLLHEPLCGEPYDGGDDEPEHRPAPLGIRVVGRPEHEQGDEEGRGDAGREHAYAAPAVSLLSGGAA